MDRQNNGERKSATATGDQLDKNPLNQEKTQVPVGIEKILFRAAKDKAFRELLLSNRQDAVLQSKEHLRSSDIEMLKAIPNDALSRGIDAINPANPRRRKFMGLVAAAAASMVAATVPGCSCAAGSSPDTECDDTCSETDTNTDTNTTDDIADGGVDGGIIRA